MANSGIDERPLRRCQIPRRRFSVFDALGIVVRVAEPLYSERHTCRIEWESRQCTCCDSYTGAISQDSDLTLVDTGDINAERARTVPQSHRWRSVPLPKSRLVHTSYTRFTGFNNFVSANCNIDFFSQSHQGVGLGPITSHVLCRGASRRNSRLDGISETSIARMDRTLIKDKAEDQYKFGMSIRKYPRVFW